MKYFLISIGGTGARCLEAFVHMNAAGFMKSNDEINIIYVDSDETNGHLKNAKEAVKMYKDAYNCISQKGDNAKFFKNALFDSEKESDSEKEKANFWNPIRSDAGSNTDMSTIFSKVSMSIDVENLNYLFDILFDEKEQSVDLIKGFKAHPAIGAAVIADKMNLETAGTVWQKMVEKIGNDSAKIFFFGSVFGGTGAAGFPNIARIVKNYLEEERISREKVKVAGCLMLPYFIIPKDDQSKEIEPEGDKFDPNTFAALNYYNTNSVVGDIYDAVYFLGDVKRYQLKKFASGNEEQGDKEKGEYRPHFLEMFAALAALDFFNRDAVSDTKCYMLSLKDEHLNWNDLPPVYDGCDMEKKLKTFIRMVYMYRTMVFSKLMECQKDHSKFDTNSWIDGYFSSDDKKNTDVLQQDETQIKIFKDYCVLFLKWLEGFTYSSEKEHAHELRCSNVINNNITDDKGQSAFYSYSDELSYEDNLKKKKAIKPQDIFPDEKNHPPYDDKKESFFQKMVAKANRDKNDPGIVGVRGLASMVYNVSEGTVKS